MRHKSIYLSPLEPQCGSLVISIGFMEMLKGNLQRVAFFRPIIEEDPKEDISIRFMIEHFKLQIGYESCAGMTRQQIVQALVEDREDFIYETLLHKLNTLYQHYDFVLIEGYPADLLAVNMETDINLQMTKNLNIPYVPVFSAKDKSEEDLFGEVHMVSEHIAEEKVPLLASFINRCEPKQIPRLQTLLKQTADNAMFFFFPEVDMLTKPTLGQVARYLNATHILGEKHTFEHLVHDKKIAAMAAEDYLEHIQDGDLVIVPGDRTDILLASILSHHAHNHPNITGMLLSGGISPAPAIRSLIDDHIPAAFPMFVVESDSYQTALAVERVPADITPESSRKIVQIKALFEAHVDKKKLVARFQNSRSDIITPMMFQYRIIQSAKANLQRIVLPESSDERILKAADILLRRNIAKIILLGDAQQITQQARTLELDISKAHIVDPSEGTLREDFAQTFYQMRKAKGLTLSVARDAMMHLNYFATMMVYEGMADGMVSGAAHTTADTIRPALQIIKTTPDTKLVSSVFFMCLETRVLVYADCAINLDPTAEELAQIAVSSADTARQFGIEPKVAMLSYSTGTSGAGPEVEKVRTATQIVQRLRPDLPVEGPIQYDAAIDETVAKQKLPNSKVAGHATVFIFPDLNTGNNTYKAVQRATGALAIGPVLQGLKLPVNDLSRGCSIDDIVNTVAITAVQAQKASR